MPSPLMPRYKVVTEDELRQSIEEIYREHPSLRGIDPSEACCAACFQHEIAGAFGWDAADAWERIQRLEYLLGGK